VYVFRGSKELIKEQVLDQLGLPSGPGGFSNEARLVLSPLAPAQGL
jgi:hypothetical protein